MTYRSTSVSWRANGTLAKAAPRFRGLAELGVDRIVAPVVVSDGPRLARTLAEHVLPAFRGADPA